MKTEIFLTNEQIDKMMEDVTVLRKARGVFPTLLTGNQVFVKGLYRPLLLESPELQAIISVPVQTAP